MEKYVKVPIYPVIKYMPEKERPDLAAPMIPMSFMYDNNAVTVGTIYSCVRGVSRKTGGRGFRYAVQVYWESDNDWRIQDSVLWFDDFLQEWFVEVPETHVPIGWQLATNVNDINDMLNEYLPPAD